MAVAGGLGVAGAWAASLPQQAEAASSATGDAATPEQELRVLEGLLGIEQVLEYAYRRVLRSWSLDSSTRGVLELVLGHEAEHRAALKRHIFDLASGLSPAARPPGSSAMSDVVTLLRDAPTPRDAVQVLTKVESLSEANYFNAIGELHSPDLVLTAAQIMASEAQHWSLLLNVLNKGDMPQVVPSPFVRGVGDLSTG
jgi:hypothetical protein